MIALNGDSTVATGVLNNDAPLKETVAAAIAPTYCRAGYAVIVAKEIAGALWTRAA